MLIILFLSCKTLPVNGSDLNWTDVPSPVDVNGNVAIEYDGQHKKVLVDEWFWFRLMDYIIDTEANKDLLNTKR